MKREFQELAEGSHHNPHEILGIQVLQGTWRHRALRPFAKSVWLETATERFELTHQEAGVWELSQKGSAPSDFRIRAVYENAPDWLTSDSYSKDPTIGELDLHLITEGRHEELWKALGARLISSKDSLGDTSGVAFTLWAPNAVAVKVVGDFNSWDGTCYPMRSMGSSGVWELFIPGVGSGALYKFQIKTKNGNWLTKIDPMAQRTETPPATSSVVTQSKYQWRDQAWLAKRANTDALKAPMSTYELHLGSWSAIKNYKEVAPKLIAYVRELGFTHVEFMPLAEHPFGGSWGYQVTGYYAPTARFGTPDDLRFLIDELHNANIGVILDWVPGHFPKDDWALARFDGEALYEDADPRRGDQPDWGTHVFNFGRTEVRNFLVANANYWLEEFHVDGLRVDAVASMLYLDYSRKDGDWLPNEFGGRENLDAIRFLQETNATAYKRNPGIMMIAEESTAFPGVSEPTDRGGLGFGFKWNMGWMHDSLEYIQRDPMYRKYHHGEITFSMLYAYDEKFVLPISHDEVVHGKGSLLSKMPGDHWQKLANMRSYLAFMWSHPGKKLLFMGQEFAQPSEWSESRELDWWLLEHAPHQGMQKLVSDLNRQYLKNPALWELDHQPEGFQWIDGGNADQNILSFLRFDKAGNPMAVVVNFSPNPQHDFRIGLPSPGTWQELINTDSEAYGGSGVGNFGAVITEPISHNGHGQSARISVPPLGAIWFVLT
ncbi:1,4-alpha-glucan branching protein GlgB [Candidatus Aquiluna sp. UB-MaderosW2red]|uniref:1,4-alpha-glucan branching protein GlgB n=1 Tax=Candidatus Aquiluna sp. UB-MaderosW2red TaxID=1855377 RepID=UPI000875F06E|nr:1,4-alpha-glucan branching protein GlgB [Candidatus Aquiluna sp. UB-MaderosW2red]SCX09691.1 1,4-alpha-glucan branching enzyme [Candidatus Aquiluna sp. UB-MaderosW2red]